MVTESKEEMTTNVTHWYHVGTKDHLHERQQLMQASNHYQKSYASYLASITILENALPRNVGNVFEDAKLEEIREAQKLVETAYQYFMNAARGVHTTSQTYINHPSDHESQVNKKRKDDSSTEYESIYPRDGPIARTVSGPNYNYKPFVPVFRS